MKIHKHFKLTDEEIKQIAKEVRNIYEESSKRVERICSKLNNFSQRKAYEKIKKISHTMKRHRWKLINNPSVVVNNMKCYECKICKVTIYMKEEDRKSQLSVRAKQQGISMNCNIEQTKSIIES